MFGLIGESEATIGIYKHKYEGQLNAQGQPHGFGKGVSEDGHRKVEGSFVNGKLHGRSKHRFIL